MTPLEIPFPDIDPVAVNLFGLRIHWYAITYLVGFAAAYVLMRRRLHHEPFRSITTPKRYTAGDIEDLLLYAIGGVIVGGRLGYVLFYKPAFYLANPLDAFKLWDGGMSFHGGAIGVVLGIAICAWTKKRPFLQMADFLVPAVPLGLMSGRIGNFINGELWGRQAPADLPWGVVFPTGGDVLRHPSQLYQALLEGLLLFIVLWLYARTPRFRGQAAAVFLAGYGLFRFIVEFYREPDAHLGFLSLGLSMGQWLSVPMMLAGVALWIWGQVRRIDDREDPADELAAEPADAESDAESDTPADEDSPEGSDAADEPVDNPGESVDDSGESRSGTAGDGTPIDK